MAALSQQNRRARAVNGRGESENGGDASRLRFWIYALIRGCRFASVRARMQAENNRKGTVSLAQNAGLSYLIAGCRSGRYPVGTWARVVDSDRTLGGDVNRRDCIVDVLGQAAARARQKQRFVALERDLYHRSTPRQYQTPRSSVRAVSTGCGVARYASAGFNCIQAFVQYRLYRECGQSALISHLAHEDGHALASVVR
eukprot:68880-Rhodomonas_salina.1